MKRILYYLISAIGIFILSLKISQAQNNVGVNTITPNKNAALEIKAIGKQGIIIPKLSATDTISGALNSGSLTIKDKGLLFYDTVGTQFLFWNGVKWNKFGGLFTNGVNGLDGKTVLNGTSDPTSAIGFIGDFYINTTSNKIFGPRSASAWPATGTSLVGPAGTDGINGTNGAAGTNGTNGVDGTNGKTVLNGITDPTAAIGVIGDFYINTTSNKIFGPRGASTWPATGTNLVGPAGTYGINGTNGAAGTNGTNGVDGTNGKTILNGTSDPTSAIGVIGDFYINTTSNKIFGPRGVSAWPATGTNLVGPAGTSGTAGTNGTNGADGINGKTVLNGTTDPTAAIGVIGDFYINTTSNKIFGPRGASAWPATGTSLVGPAGTNGTAGTNGADGTNGKTVLNGITDPTAAIGVIGDFYINTTSNKIFGPRGASAWPATGTSLVGPAGTNGTNGTNGADGTNGKTVLNGTTDPTAAIGVIGDFYINTTSNKIFGPRGASTWPVTGTNLVGPAGGFSITGTTGQTIYHDGTDWKATSNLYNNGTKIGIGTTPSYMLHVIDKSADPAIFARQGGSGLAIQGNNIAGGIGVLGGGFSGAGVFAYIATGGSGTALYAKTDGTGPAGIFEGGKVGIGTLTPNLLLTVDGTTSDADIQLINKISGNSTNDGLVLNFDGTDARLLNYEKGNLILGTTGNKSFIIDNSGKIQIPSLVGPGVVEADNSGNLSIGTAMSGSGTKNYIPKWSATGSSLGDSRLFDDGSFVGIGRTSSITGLSYFDIELPTVGATYGGMYLNSQSITGKPFYGYAINGTATAWTYLDGTTKDWRIYNSGDRLIVKNTGVVQIPNLAGAGSVLSDALGNLSVNKCAFAATNSVVFKIPFKSTQTTMVFDKVLYDISSNFASNAFKAPEAGIYHFDATVSFDPASTFGIQYRISLFKGATLMKGVNFPSTVAEFSGNISADLSLAAGDVITVKIWQEEIIDRPTLFGVANCYFNGHRIF